MIEIRSMRRSEVEKVYEIDRSEHITMLYRMDGDRLVSETIDFQDHGWADDDGDHSFGHIIDLAERMMDAQGTMIGAFDEDRLAGLAIFRPRLTETLGELALLHVSCPYRRQGIASRLLAEVEKLARVTGAKTLYVSAHPSGSAVGFYHRHGFEPTRQPHPELLALEPEDIHMTKPL